MGPISKLCLSQKDAAELIGVSRRFLTIDDDDPPPREADGKYNAVDLVAWFVKRGSEIDEQIKSEKLRKLKRDNDVAEKRLVDVESLREHTIVLQDCLREYGDAVARKKKLTGPQAQSMFNKALRTAEVKLATIANADG